MGSYIINVETPSGVTGSVVADIGYNYTEFLNEINEAILKFSGTGSVKRSLLVIGSKVEIKRNGTREFYGQIESIDILDSGGIVAYVSGFEIWLAKENGSYASSPYINVASATINSDIIGESSYFTAGTIDAGTNIDFRVNKGESLWNGISNLKRKTTQDIGIDYVNLEVDILDHKGSSTSVATFNDGINIRNVRVTETYPKGNKVRVYGKGDGNLQITATAEDATSISTYGPITRDITDKSLISTSEAQRLANAERDITKDPTKIYDFEVINPNQSLVSGDVITLNSTDKDLSNEEVRIVAIIRGMRGKSEFLQLQVTNLSYSQLLKRKSKVLAKIEKDNRDLNTYMDGTGNVLTWSRGINAKSGTPQKMSFYIPSGFITDEAGNLRVKSMTLDYDIDPYRRGVASASESDSNPALDGATAAASHVHNPADAGHQHSDPLQTSSSYTGMTDQGADLFSGTTLNIGWNNNQLSQSVSGTLDFIYVRVILQTDFNNSDFNAGIRIHVAGNYYINRIHMHADTGISIRVIRETFIFPIFSSISSTVYVDIYSSVNSSYTGWLQVYSANITHTHTISQHNVDSGTSSISSSNQSPSVTRNTVAHNHSVSVGDGISDGGSVNASEVDIYLDFWNTGTSTWDNKHSILNTGKTLDTDVDITDSGTYPDAAGYWRIRIDPDNASPDYVQGIVKLHHSMDN